MLSSGMQPIASEVWQVVTSWPVYAVSLLLTGAWLQDWFDARLRASEGHPSWFGVRALRTRLLFAAWIVGRPKLYSDEYKIRRELERTDVALVRAGFAPLAGLPLDATDDVGPTREYLKSLGALVPAIGADRAAAASHVLKQRLLPAPVVPLTDSAIIADETSRPLEWSGRSIADIFASLFGRADRV